MRSSLFGAILATTLLVGALASTAQAQLYGISPVSSVNVGSPDSLYRIDVTSGNATLVTTLNGTYNRVGASGLAFLNGTFYASNISLNDRTQPSLVTINAQTGATALVADTPDGSYGLAGNGTLLYSFDDDTDTLYSVDTANGFTQTTISTTTGLDYVDGLTFGNGLLWGVNDATNTLFTINPFTGGVNTIGGTGVTLGPYSGLALLENTLYLATGDFNTSTLYSLDTTTGAATLIGNITDTANGQAIGISGLTAVAPEPGTLALMGVVGLVGGLVRRRK